MRLRRLLLIVCISTAGLVRPLGGAQTLEQEIKAAFLYNFAKFVEWPADAFSSSDQPLTFCLLGPDPFGHVLDDLLAGEQVRNRPLAIRRIERAAQASGCHILFVSPQERDRFKALLSGVDRQRVLTVSDAMEFLNAGGHMSFFVEAHRVRFAVNAPAVERAAFQMSARLLQVARVHRPASPGSEP